jgi:hypothetical protein
LAHEPIDIFPGRPLGSQGRTTTSERGRLKTALAWAAALVIFGAAGFWAHRSLQAEV